MTRKQIPQLSAVRCSRNRQRGPQVRLGSGVVFATPQRTAPPSYPSVRLPTARINNDRDQELVHVGAGQPAWPAARLTVVTLRNAILLGHLNSLPSTDE